MDKEKIISLVAESEKQKKELFDERIKMQVEKILLQKGMNYEFADFIITGFKPKTSEDVIQAVNEFNKMFNTLIQKEVEKRFNRQKY